MPKYLIQGSYTAEGTKGVRKDGGSKRRQVAEALMKEAGARLEAFYFTFGDTDFVGVVDAPDNVSIAAMALAVYSSAVSSLRTPPLLTPEEVEATTKTHITD